MKKLYLLIALTTLTVTYSFAQNNFPTPTGNVGIGIGTSASRQLHVHQLAGSSKGLLISGDEYYQTGNGDANGILLIAGVNRVGNRQLWIGDNTSLGSTTNGFFRYLTGNPLPSIDAISGTGLTRFPVNIGTPTSNVALGFEYTGATSTTLPASRLSVNGNLSIGNSYIGTAAPANGLLIQGSVGVGTSSPDFKFKVVDNTTGAVVGLQNSNSSGYTGFEMRLADNSNWGAFFGYQQSTDHLRFNVRTGDVRFFGNSVETVRFTNSGKVGIGTTNTNDPNYKLFVETGIRTRKLKVDLTSWPDYVFTTNYKLPSLEEVEAYIKQHQHLPEVTSATEVEKNGLDVGENQAVLLRKIEELTLYVIEQNKKTADLQRQLESQQKEIGALRQQLAGK